MSTDDTRKQAWTFDQALEKLRKSCFRIRIEKEGKGDDGVWFFGSGFFVTDQGHALTAFHNLPKNVRRRNAGSVDVFFGGKGNKLDTHSLEFKPELSDPEKDIAVLQLPNARVLGIEPLTPSYIPLDVGEDKRAVSWHRSGPLYVFGFPVHGVWQGAELKSAQPEYLIQGKVALLVSGPVTECGSDGTPDVVIERLHIDGNQVWQLEGLSGGPVIDAKKGWAIAVEGSYLPGRGVVFATELAHMVKKWECASDKTLIESLRKREFTDWQASVTSAAKKKLDSNLWDQLRKELAGVFPTADAVIVDGCLPGQTSDQSTEVVLGVEAQYPDRHEKHVVKLGVRDRVKNDYEGFQQCLQGQPFASRTLVRVSRHDLAGNRAAIIYENAWKFYRDDTEGEACSLVQAVERSVKTNEPEPPSIERVIRQVYDDLKRCFHFLGNADSRKAACFYQRRLNKKAWQRWQDEAWRERLRRNLIWLCCGRDAPDADQPAAYLDPCDYVHWALKTKRAKGLPESLVGPAHGNLDGRNVLVGIERGEAEHPVVFDYGRMSPRNVLAWDFVKLETELKMRLLRDLYDDDEVRKKLCPGPDAPDDWRKYLDPQRPSVLLERDDFPVGRLAFGFWFERKLAELTRQIAVAPATEKVDLTGNAKLDRALAILLRIRREAAQSLGSRPYSSGGAHPWRDDYYFALAACSCYTATLDARDHLTAGLALVSGGVAAAQMESSRETIQALGSEASDPPSGPCPSYHVPMRHGYRLWARGSQRTREQALAVFARARNDFPHAVPLVREYALVLAASDQHERARSLVAPLRPLCRVFGDYETLCRIARTWRDEGNKLWDERPVAVSQIRGHAIYEWYKTAFELYEEAFDFSEHYYPGVCTAQLAASLGLLDRARDVAASVLEICDRLTLGELPAGEQFWVLDSRAIALLVMGETTQAVQLYRRALGLVPAESAGPVQTSYDGICRLHWALGEAQVKPVANVFWESRFHVKPGPMGDCGRISGTI